MEQRPRQIGVAGVVVTAGGVGELPPAGGHGLAHGHQSRRQVGPAGIELQPAVLDHVIGLHHQAQLHLRRVVEGRETREEAAHQLGNASAHAGGVDPDIGHPVALGHLADELGLSGEIHAPELVPLQHTELAARHRWWRHHHQPGGVPGLCRVIPQPDLAVCERTGREGLVVLVPLQPAVHHARLQHRQRKDTRAVVDELAHQQVLEGLGVVLMAQFFQVEQIAAAALGIQDRDDLPPELVLAQTALGQGAVADVDLHVLGNRLALVEALARPERVGLMGHRAGRREVGPAVLLLHRHARGNLVQLGKLERPEEFVEVEIPVVALGGAGVGPEEVQLGAIGQHNRVTLQFDADNVTREGLDVALEDVRLGLRGRQENLVAPRGQRIDQGLAGEVERGADLPALQDDAGPHPTGAVPVLLVVEALIEERFDQLLDQVFVNVIALGFALRPGVAVGQLRVEVGFRAAALVALDSRLPLQLAVQQVDFLEVAAGLAVFQDQLDKPRFQRAADPFYAIRPVPTVAILPAVKGLFLLVQEVGNVADAPTHPVQELGLAAVIADGDFDGSIHCADAAARARPSVAPNLVAPVATKPRHCSLRACCRPCPQRNGPCRQH
ncbi:MAG: hypothetical protein GAK45_00147 [Pseudomonas citronellolis]|nr:MAG: hypothetical protein GAK45_00147 [Pseudomonas citronellolis]